MEDLSKGLFACWFRFLLHSVSSIYEWNSFFPSCWRKPTFSLIFFSFLGSFSEDFKLFRLLPYVIVLEFSHRRKIVCSTNLLYSSIGNKVVSFVSDVMSSKPFHNMRRELSHRVIFAGIFPLMNPGSILNCLASKKIAKIHQHFNFLDIRWRRLILKNIFFNIPISDTHFKVSIALIYHIKSQLPFIFLCLQCVQKPFAFVNLNQDQKWLMQEKNLSSFFNFSTLNEKPSLPWLIP